VPRRHRLSQGTQNAPGDARRGVPRRVTVHHDGELVATDASDRIRVAYRSTQRRGDVSQDVVAGLVSERVVDGLEVVEVQEEHRHRWVGGGDGGVEPVVEETAVGEPGQWIGQRPTLQLDLERVTLDERATQIADDPDEPRDDQQEQDDASQRDDRNVDRVVQQPLDDQHCRRHQRRCGQHGQADAGQVHLVRRCRLGDQSHRRMDRRSRREDRGGQPAEVDDVAHLVAVGERHDGKREVGGEQRDERPEQQAQRGSAPPRRQEEPHQGCQQQHVQNRIGQRHADLEERRVRIGHPRLHDEGPGEQAGADRDDGRIGQAGSIATGDAPAQQADHAERQEDHAAQVEDVGHRWERLHAERLEQHPQPVADGGCRDPRRQQEPRGALPGSMDADGEDDGDGTDHLRDLVGEVLRPPRQQREVDEDEARTSQQVGGRRPMPATPDAPCAEECGFVPGLSKLIHARYATCRAFAGLWADCSAAVHLMELFVRGSRAAAAVAKCLS
jgi:hypothetical protein